MAVDTVLDEAVYNGRGNHAGLHNQVNDQVNWLTEQLAPVIGDADDLGAGLLASFPALDGVRRNWTVDPAANAALDAAFLGSDGYGVHLTGSSSEASTGYRAVVGIGTDLGDWDGIFLSQKNAGNGIRIINNPGATKSALLLQGLSTQTATAEIQVYPSNFGVMISAKAGKGYAGGQIEQGSQALYVPGGDFTSADIGRGISQTTYTGTSTDQPGTIPPGTTVTAVADPQHITISNPAAHTGTALQLQLAGRLPGTSQSLLRFYDETDTLLAGFYKTYLALAVPIASAADSNVALTVQGTTTQTAALLKVQRSGDGTARVDVNAAGLFSTRYGAVANNAGSTGQIPLTVQSFATTGTAAIVVKSPTTPAVGADLLRFTDSGATTSLSRVNRDGSWVTHVNAAPASGDLSAGELAVWFDQTPGAAKLMVKAKDSAGTVVTGSVALA